jgi:2-oxoglutarate ferredoxin oxidoreductase subunit alpha
LTETNEISILIGGEAGTGISAAGFMLGKAFLRGGLHVFGTIDYPSLIRGGHNFYMIRAAKTPVYSQWDSFNLIIALDALTLRRHKHQIGEEGGFIYDSDQIPQDSSDIPEAREYCYPVPLETITKEIEGRKVVKNTVALGAALGILGYDIDLLIQLLTEQFERKGEKVVSMNERAARAGYDYAQTNYANHFCCQLKPLSKHQKSRILLTGNEAVALGAIAAGCKFYSAYPMTPASPVLHYLISQAERFGMVVIQAESEIAAINMTIGAAHAGVRAMTGTSGGGFCLMTEAFGLAGMTETPIVVMLGQRTGPSTGLPTYTGQSDLRFAIHASHGEFPRIVIAPGDVQECFDATIDAFNLAEEFQMPVILLTDKHLIESHADAKAFKVDEIPINRGKLLPYEPYTGTEPYLRHRYTPDGISDRLIPGTPGALLHTDSAVHKESGFQGDDCSIAAKMADKRFLKMDKLRKTLTKRPTIKLHGPKTAKTTLVSWGSTKGAIFEAMRLLKKTNEQLNFLQVIYLEPFPAEAVSKALNGKKVILIENNQTAQLASFIHEHTHHTITHKILRYDGRPFNPLQLTRKIQEILKKGGRRKT